MIEKARVLSAEGNKVTLQCLQSAACRGCGSKGFCSTTARTFIALNRDTPDLVPGEVVEVELNGPKAVGFGFMSLIFPLLLFIAAYLTLGAAIPVAGEGLKVLSGFGGLAVGFLISWGITKLSGKKGWPIILGREEKQS